MPHGEDGGRIPEQARAALVGLLGPKAAAGSGNARGPIDDLRHELAALRAIDSSTVGPADVLQAVRAMGPAERRELAGLLHEAYRSEFLHLPGPDGKFVAPTGLDSGMSHANQS